MAKVEKLIRHADLENLADYIREVYGIHHPGLGATITPEDFIANPEFFAVLRNFFETRTTNTL